MKWLREYDWKAVGLVTLAVLVISLLTLVLLPVWFFAYWPVAIVIVVTTAILTPIVGPSKKLRDLIRENKYD